MYDFGVPETAEQHLDNSRSQKGKVSGKVSMTRVDVCPDWESQVATHVEELVRLGWRWEGRGLVPTTGCWQVSNRVSKDINCETV